MKRDVHKYTAHGQRCDGSGAIACVCARTCLCVYSRVCPVHTHVCCVCAHVPACVYLHVAVCIVTCAVYARVLSHLVLFTWVWRGRGCESGSVCRGGSGPDSALASGPEKTEGSRLWDSMWLVTTVCRDDGRQRGLGQPEGGGPLSVGEG